MTEWEKVEMSPTWDYKKQPEFIGLYLGMQEKVGPNESKMYDFEISGGGNMSVWGNTVLDVRLKNVAVGDEVKIVYLGPETSDKTKREYHNFDVFHRKPVVEEVKIDIDKLEDF